jgi:hypothetical protein
VRGGRGIEGATGFHEEAEQVVGVGIAGCGGEVWAGGGQGQDAEQAGIAEGAAIGVAEDEDVRGEVAAEGAVLVQARSDGGEGIGGVERDACLGEEVAQLRDLFRVAGGEFFELQGLKHGDLSFVGRVKYADTGEDTGIGDVLCGVGSRK